VSLLRGFARRDAVSNVDGPLIPSRGSGGRKGSVVVTDESSMRHSAVWACLQTRAGLMSTFPLDVFTKVGKVQIERPTPPVLLAPGGEEWDYMDWMYASQMDLDRAGNAIGLITARNALGLPSRIELQPISACTIIQDRDGTVSYRIFGEKFRRDQVWHERQYVMAGLAAGLSPLAYAAWSVGEYLSMQQFALDWFGGAAVPKARLKNTDRKVVDAKEAGILKDRWNATVSDGDLFVYGSTWEYDMVQAEQAGMEWIEGRRFGLTDITRFLGCPADLIDAAISAPGTVTYATITQRNLQFLIMQLGPAVNRREKNLTKLLPRPRFVKLNTDALLRMDPAARGEVMNAAIDKRRLTVSEARELDNRPPLTPDQEAEYVRLFGAPRVAPATGTASLAAGPDHTDTDMAAAPIRVLAHVGGAAKAIESGPPAAWEGAT